MAIQNNTGSADTELMIGGKVSSGINPGVYHVKVTSIGETKSKGNPKANPPKPPRGCLELTLFVTKKDKIHVTKHDKKLMVDRTYFPVGSDDSDKKAQMGGMVKRKLFDGFGVPWPKEAGKRFDPRSFQAKEAYVWVDYGSEDDNGEARSEVKAIAVSTDKLPKKAREWLKAIEEGKDPNAESADGEAEAPAQKARR